MSVVPRRCKCSERVRGSSDDAGYPLCQERRGSHRLSGGREWAAGPGLRAGFVSNLDHQWDDPALAHFLSRLASFSRLILFDKRGTGLSDRTGSLPTLEERMDDVRAVMDAVGSE